MAVSKAQIRHWLKRVRLDIKDIERLLKEPGPLDDEALDYIREWGMDIAGAGAAIEELAGGD